MQLPNRGTSRHIDDVRLPLPLKNLGSLHATMTTLADQQHLTISRHLSYALLKLAKWNITGLPGMSIRVFPGFAYINQHN